MEPQTGTEVPDSPATYDLPLVGGGVLASILVLALLGFGLRAVLRPRPPLLPGPAVEAPAQGAPVPTGVADRLFAALGRSRELLASRWESLRGKAIDDTALLELEESLLLSDVGIATAERLLAPIRARLREAPIAADTLRTLLVAEMESVLTAASRRIKPPDAGIWVILVVGVNGSGKTTTIGKLAARLGAEGRRVLVAAGDTYRAAASEQLTVWAERAGAQIVMARSEGQDPASVAFEALQQAQSRGCDTVLVDTAGRLQTARPLMEQLSKMRRVIAKAVPDAPHDTLLVIDGTMGQNALSQARLFHEATPLTGVVVTKLDGTAKGGVVLAVANEIGVPIVLIGIGEKVEDLRDFDPAAFAGAIA